MRAWGGITRGSDVFSGLNAADAGVGGRGLAALAGSVSMAMAMVWEMMSDLNLDTNIDDDIPWNKKSPTIFEARPSDPTITTRRGCEISAEDRISDRSTEV